MTFRKAFRKKRAVQQVTLSIDAGQIVAILGPNGAGKTTTINMMLGLLNRDEGSVRVLGGDPRAPDIKEKIGAMLQDVNIIDGLKVKELIALFTSYYPSPLAKDELLRLAGLEAEQNAFAERLSGGQKRRLGFALAIAGNPELLFLDEPTVGMDIRARRSFWDTIKGFAAKGKTIIFFQPIICKR